MLRVWAWVWDGMDSEGWRMWLRAGAQAACVPREGHGGGLGAVLCAAETGYEFVTRKLEE